MIHQLTVKRNGRFDPLDHKFIKGAFHFIDGLFSCLCSGNQLGNHRVVVRGNHIAPIDVGVESNPMSTRSVQGLNHSWRWTKIIIWILGIDTTFDRVEFGIIVFSAQSVSGSHFDLLRNQVIINDLFGNRVFNLNPRVHFHKIEIAVFVHQKLNCTCPFIFDKFGGFYSGFPHFFPQFICHKGRRGFFGQFLVTTLNRTVSF